MHWVIQRNIFKPVNYQLLTNSLDRLEISYTSIFIPNATYNLEPEVLVKGNVYICGAIKLKKIAEQREWYPGSFLNENFSFDKWLLALGSELLNFDALFGKTFEIEINHLKEFFIRPLEDNKAFNGEVINHETLSLWKKDPSKKYLLDLDVIVSPVKNIYKEYRLFIVKNKIITGSVYKINGKGQVSTIIEDSVVEYVSKIIKKWVPCESFVIDICLTENGYKIIEFNNINSSGFYASDISKYVESIQVEYSEK